MPPLKPEIWKRIRRLFDAAVDLPVEERARYLEEMCPDDPVLRRQVESMILASADGVERLESVIAGVSTVVDLPTPAAEPGQQIGRYRLIAPLGEGGMGAVYLAERLGRDYRQRVALKIVSTTVRRVEALKRSSHERQILASLRHPNIASLLDGGVTDEGVSYLAMEYVDGLPVTEFCDSRRLPIDRRLRLFRTICGAVQYAHRNLVVHRDLKPSNILVDSEEVPKLLDFGIAKLLREDLTPRDGTLTLAGLQALTPAYAAPEQVLGDPITTATDVYALGLILFELLTGRRAQTVDLKRPQELVRVVAETDPQRPSTVVKEKPGLEQPRLRRSLRGDLDNIVLKALRKDPARRYVSVEQLSEDIRRHLEGLPVTARPDVFTYRASKFVGRHRLAVAASLLVVSMLGLFGLRERGLRGEAEAAGDLARLEGEKASAINSFLSEMLTKANPGTTRGEDLTVRELLDQVAAEIGASLAGQSAVEIEIRRTVGKTYEQIGLYDSALEQLRQAYVLARRESDAATPAVDLDLAHLLNVRGDLDQAEEILRRTLDELRGERAADPVDLGRTLQILGQVLRHKGDLPAAEPLLRESLLIWRGTSDDWMYRVSTLEDLAHTLREKGDLAGAAAAHREALDLLERFEDEGNPVRRASIQNNLAVLRRQQGEYEQAAELLEESLRVKRQLFGDRHPGVAVTSLNLGNLYVNMDRLDEGEVLLRQSLELHRALFPGDHEGTAMTLTRLAELLVKRGEGVEAELLLVEADGMAERRFGGRHPMRATILLTLGQSLLSQRRLQEADRYTEQAVDILRHSLGDAHEHVGRALTARGGILRAARRHDEAEAVLRDALAITEASLGAEHDQVGKVHDELGQLAMAREDWQAAEVHLRRALQLFLLRLRAEHSDVLDMKSKLGAALAAQGKLEEAEPLLRESKLGLQHALGEDHPRARRAERRWDRLRPGREPPPGH